MKGARALTPLEIQAVCTAFSGQFAIRNQTLFLVCANVGTRITEALNLNVGDVLQNGEVVDVLYLRRQTVKGKQSGASLTLPHGARKALAGYLKWKLKVKESLGRTAPLFVSRQGGRLTRQQAHNAFKKAFHKVGLKGQVTTHSPRKSYARTVYEKSNNDLLVTQQALRHTSVDMTLYYLDTISDNVSQAMPNYDFSADLREPTAATEFDIIYKTSNSKIVYLSEVAQKQGRSESEKSAEDVKKQIS